MAKHTLKILESKHLFWSEYEKVQHLFEVWRLLEEMWSGTILDNYFERRPPMRESESLLQLGCMGGCELLVGSIPLAKR